MGPDRRRKFPFTPIATNFRVNTGGQLPYRLFDPLTRAAEVLHGG